MKKSALLSVVVILLVVVGVVLGVMQPWKKDGDAQKSDGKSSDQKSASVKEPQDNGNSQEAKKPKSPPSTTKPKEKGLTKIATRAPMSRVSTKKTEEHADKNSTTQAHANPKPSVLVGKHDPPSDLENTLIGSWVTEHDGFEFTIILEKGGKGKMLIAEGERKATHVVTWKADTEKLTLASEDPETHDEDVTEGAYKLSNESGVKLLQLEYGLEKQKFTFVSVED